ncbi:MAG: hypothetical protein JXL81_05845, partial [Deltaproteobacteria bacterium]|nr:hypothetical protein [Deltaproteobacteria bacterium]
TAIKTIIIFLIIIFMFSPLSLIEMFTHNYYFMQASGAHLRCTVSCAQNPPVKINRHYRSRRK